MIVGAVMPTLDQAEFIGDALASVTPQVDRLVIVNDGSTDATQEIATAWMARHEHVKLHRKLQNRGTAEAINIGAALLGACDWMTWVSSDNVHTDDWMVTLTGAIEDDVGVVYSGFHWAKPGTKGRYLFTKYAPEKQIATEDCFLGPSFIIRQDVWQPHRGRISHDYDQFLRVEEACWAKGLRIVGVDKSLCRYNAHDKRVTVTRKHEYDAPHWQAEARKRRAS